MAKRIIGDDVARILSKLDRSQGDDACWPYIGAISSHNYGNFYLRGKYINAHRAAYMLLVGQIAAGMEVDHTCHNGSGCPGGDGCIHRRCCNPKHLEVATHKENDLRGASLSAVNARKTHCPAGHPYDAMNTYIRKMLHGRPVENRDCRRCRAISRRRSEARKKERQPTA